MAATLNKEMLDTVMMGIASIKLTKQTGTLTATTFDDADEIFTTRDSLSITQSAPTKTEIKVDQFDTAIAVAYEPGEFTITGQIPSVAKELLDYFFETTGSPTAITGYKSATGVEAKTKPVSATMLIESQDKSAGIVFMNTEFVANFAWDSTSTTLLRIEFTATVKANPNGEDIVILSDKAAASPASL